jgi:hypothetical protein
MNKDSKNRLRSGPFRATVRGSNTLSILRLASLAPTKTEHPVVAPSITTVLSELPGLPSSPSRA